MSKREYLIKEYAEHLRTKCGVEPDMDLLAKVTIGCGPSIYNPKTDRLSGADPEDFHTIRNKFLIGKLGLPDGPKLDEAIASVEKQYGISGRQKYRAVFYYLLVKSFGKEGTYT